MRVSGVDGMDEDTILDPGSLGKDGGVGGGNREETWEMGYRGSEWGRKEGEDGILFPGIPWWDVLAEA